MDREIENLQKVIGVFIDAHVKEPIFETIEKDFNAQATIADILDLFNISWEIMQKHGIEFDKEYLKGLPREEIERRIKILSDFIKSKGCKEDKTSEEAIKILRSGSSNKYLLIYLDREIKWIAISILSASYVSSLVLMRSTFELLIGIATKETGSMKRRIESIEFLSPDEKKEIMKIWKELCGWSHPYGKWIKEICPIFAGYGPLYHPTLCKSCIQKLKKVTDLLLVLKIEIESPKNKKPFLV